MRRRTLLVVFILALVAALPAFAADTYTGVEYGGYNLVQGNVLSADLLYPPQVRAFFDGADAMFTDDVKAVDTPTISGQAGGVGELKAGFGSLKHGERARSSSTQEIIDFVKAQPTKYMRYRIVGSFPDYNNDGTPAGIWHDMVLAVFSSDGSILTAEEAKAAGKPVVWIQAQIHGNENSATEGALELIRRLAAGEFAEELTKVTVVVLPRWNLDGGRRYMRGTNILANRNIGLAGMDQNRDHMVLQSYFTKLIHKLVLGYDPVAVLDMHEMGYNNSSGHMKLDGIDTVYAEYQLHDIATLPGMNPNIPENVRNLAYNTFQKRIQETLEDQGFYWHFYDESIATTPTAFAMVLSTDLQTWVAGDSFTANLKTATCEGTSDEGVGRPNFGFLPAISFLSESRSPKLMPSFLRRVYTHYLTAAAMIRAAADNAETLKAMKTDASRAMIEEDDLLLRLEFPAHTEAWPAATWDAANNKIVASSREITVYRSRYAKADSSIVGSSVKKPTAYILPNSEIMDKVAGKLMNVGVKFQRLTEDVQMNVQTYTITDIARGIGFKLEGRANPKTLGGIANNEGIQGVSKSAKTMTVPKDSYILYTDQVPATIAALTIEPMAMRNLANYWYVNSADEYAAYCREEGFFEVRVGDEYPVYRYEETGTLPTYAMRSDLPPDVIDGVVAQIVPLSQTELDGIAASLDKTTSLAYASKFNVVMPVQAADGSVTLSVPVDAEQNDFYALNAAGTEWIAVSAGTSIKVPSTCIANNGGIFLTAYGKESSWWGGGSSGCSTAGFASFGLFSLATLFLVRRKK